MDHLGVLDAGKKTEHAQYAGGQAKIETHAIRVSGPSSCAGADDHFVQWKILNQFLDQREYSGPTPINEALAANLYDVGLGKNPNCRLRVDLSHPLLIGEVASHQRLGNLVYAVVHWSSPSG